MVIDFISHTYGAYDINEVQLKVSLYKLTFNVWFLYHHYNFEIPWYKKNHFFFILAEMIFLHKDGQTDFCTQVFYSKVFYFRKHNFFEKIEHLN